MQIGFGSINCNLYWYITLDIFRPSYDIPGIIYTEIFAYYNPRHMTALHVAKVNSET